MCSISPSSHRARPSAAAAAQKDGTPGTSSVSYPRAATRFTTYQQVEYTVGSPSVRNATSLPSSSSAQIPSAARSWLASRAALSRVIGMSQCSTGLSPMYSAAMVSAA